MNTNNLAYIYGFYAPKPCLISFLIDLDLVYYRLFIFIHVKTLINIKTSQKVLLVLHTSVQTRFIGFHVYALIFCAYENAISSAIGVQLKCNWSALSVKNDAISRILTNELFQIPDFRLLRG